MYDNNKLDVVSEYEYLGVIFDEFVNYNRCSQTLADSGSRALGAVWAKFNTRGNGLAFM